jgi:hypothetical protein
MFELGGEVPDDIRIDALRNNAHNTGATTYMQTTAQGSCGPARDDCHPGAYRAI